MGADASYPRIRTDGTLRETARHGSEAYPLQYYVEDIYQFDFHCIDWHWHSEVELVLVERGAAECLVGSGRYTLRAGMGIFINSQIIHRFEAKQSTLIPNIVYSPALLAPEGGLIDQKYIQPVLHAPVDCLVFSPDVPWQAAALEALRSVFAAQGAEGGEIRTVEALLRLWELIYQNIGAAESAGRERMPAHTRAQLQIMLRFIQENYARRLTLEDIARTVSLSKNGALDLFRRFFHTSPINFLMQYRLKRAARLLVTTEDSVSSIAQDTGFESSGYFCRRFKELFQVTPGEYRKKRKHAAELS